MDWISPINESIFGVGIIARPLFTNKGSSKISRACAKRRKHVAEPLPKRFAVGNKVAGVIELGKKSEQLAGRSVLGHIVINFDEDFCQFLSSMTGKLLYSNTRKASKISLRSTPMLTKEKQLCKNSQEGKFSSNLRSSGRLSGHFRSCTGCKSPASGMDGLCHLRFLQPCTFLRNSVPSTRQ